MRLVATAAAAIRADTTSITPDDIFRTDGLVRDGKWLVLQAESDVHNRVWALQQSDEAVRSATSTHRSLQPELIQGQNTIEAIADQRASLLKTINGFKGKTDNDSIDAMNRTITQSDQLWSKLVREQEMLDGLSQRESQVEEARARFIGGIMDAQAKADAIVQTYSHLAQNDVLSAAIAQANANADQALTLGPSPQFTEDQQFLHDSAQRIVSAWVAVQKANTIGGLHVLPIINGKLTVSMTWDSGCSDTQLSRDTAAALGLDLNDKSPSIEITIANGATIKAKKAVLDSVQLGPFTLHSVECVVMEGSDLLGNSFQSHFLSRLDQQSGKLQLTPIDSSVDIGAIGEPVFASQQNSQPNSQSPAYRPPSRPKDFDLGRLATATASSTMDGSTPRRHRRHRRRRARQSAQRMGLRPANRIHHPHLGSARIHQLSQNVGPPRWIRPHRQRPDGFQRREHRAFRRAADGRNTPRFALHLAYCQVDSFRYLLRRRRHAAPGLRGDMLVPVMGIMKRARLVAALILAFALGLRRMTLCPRKRYLKTAGCRCPTPGLCFPTSQDSMTALGR